MDDKKPNNRLIDEIINDPLFRIGVDGIIHTRVNKSGWTMDEWRVKAQSINRTGYLTVRYKTRHLQVHRVIYRKFIGELIPGLEINHIDGNPKNNDASNLEQVTHSQNQEHAYRVLKRKSPVHHKKITHEIAEEIRAKKPLNSLKRLAKEYGISKSTVSYIVNNKTWK